MRFSETRLRGVWIVELERREDERGFFARSFCADEFRSHGLHAAYPQHNVSYNRRRHTLRGMHFNAAPHGEVKVVRCTAGAIFDVVVDLRKDSPTRFQWIDVELNAQNRKQLYVPTGFAHGFLTLADDTEVFYSMGSSFVASAARGLRWNDPKLGIEWPADPAVISERDATYPDLDPEALDV